MGWTSSPNPPTFADLTASTTCASGRPSERSTTRHGPSRPPRPGRKPPRGGNGTARVGSGRGCRLLEQGDRFGRLPIEHEYHSLGVQQLRLRPDDLYRAASICVALLAGSAPPASCRRRRAALPARSPDCLRCPPVSPDCLVSASTREFVGTVESRRRSAVG